MDGFGYGASSRGFRDIRSHPAGSSKSSVPRILLLVVRSSIGTDLAVMLRPVFSVVGLRLPTPHHLTTRTRRMTHARPPARQCCPSGCTSYSSWRGLPTRRSSSWGGPTELTRYYIIISSFICHQTIQQLGRTRRANQVIYYYFVFCHQTIQQLGRTHRANQVIYEVLLFHYLPSDSWSRRVHQNKLLRSLDYYFPNNVLSHAHPIFDQYFSPKPLQGSGG